MNYEPPPPLRPPDPWIAAQRRDFAERCVCRMTGEVFASAPLPGDLEAEQMLAIMVGALTYPDDGRPDPSPALAIAAADRLREYFRDVADYLALTDPELVFLVRVFSAGGGYPKNLLLGLGLFGACLFEAQGDVELGAAPLQLLIDRAREEAEL